MDSCNDVCDAEVHVCNGACGCVLAMSANMSAMMFAIDNTYLQ
jgi:hypothetical protein